MAETDRLVAHFIDISNGVGGYNVTDVHDLTDVQKRTKMSIKCEVCKKLGRGMIETCNGSHHFCCVSCVSDSYSKWVLNDLPESTMMMSCPVPGCRCAFKERKTNDCMKKSELLEFSYENLDPHKSLLFLNLVETGAIQFKCCENNFVDKSRQPTLCVETFDDHVKLHAHQKKCIFTFQICHCGDFIGTREEVQSHRALCGCVVDLEAQNSKFKIEYLHRRTMKELAQRRQGTVPSEEDRSRTSNHTVPLDSQTSETNRDSIVLQEDSMEVSTLSTSGASEGSCDFFLFSGASSDSLEEHSVAPIVTTAVDAPSTGVNLLEEHSVATDVSSPTTLSTTLEVNCTPSEYDTVSGLSRSIITGMIPCTLSVLQSSERNMNSFFRLVKIKKEKESFTCDSDTASSPCKRLLKCDDSEDIYTMPTKKRSTELYTFTDSELSWTNFVGLCQTLYDNLLMDCSPETASILMKLKRLGEDKSYLTKCNIECITDFLDLRKKDSRCDSSRVRFLDSMIRKLTLSYSV